MSKRSRSTSNNIVFTPTRQKTKQKNPYLTFNNQESHHDLYDLLTYNITEFHDFLRMNIIKDFKYFEIKKNNNQYFTNQDIYIKMKQKPFFYDGTQNTQSNKGEFIIEFINENNPITSLFFSDKFRDVHFTLHKYSNKSNKLHFRFIPHNGKSFSLELDYFKNIIDMKKIQINNLIIQSYLKKNNLNSSNILNICRIIITIMNNYIQYVINEKQQKCKNNKYNKYKINNKKNFPVFPVYTNENELEEGEVLSPSTNLKGGNKKSLTKDKLIKICKNNNLKGYSQLKKQELINFIKKKNIKIT